MNISTQATDYTDVAKNKFIELSERYISDYSNISFWKLGNTFDTLIDGLEFIQHLDPDNTNAIATTAIKAFDYAFEKLGVNKTWFDDYGWWCVAFTRALEKPFFASHREEFQRRHDLCWKQFSENAPFVWERRTTTQFDHCGPAVEGGVWNEYWIGTSDKYRGPHDGEPNTTDPVNTLHGVQNTVTNALYLMSAQRQSNEDAQNQANNERQFLFSWLQIKTNSLWWEIDQSSGLVRERVGHFAEDKKTPTPGFRNDWAWSGDQGLLLSDLCDSLTRSAPIYHQEIINWGNSILNGVKYKLTKNHNGPIKNSTNEAIAPDGDLEDYRTGSGIFWRNILHIWNVTDVFHPAILSSDYKQIIRASADEASGSDDNSVDALTNQLAALVAATVILK